MMFDKFDLVKDKLTMLQAETARNSEEHALLTGLGALVKKE